MYVCLEGVKGSGKSTILAGVLRWLDENRIEYVTVNPTRAAPPDTPLERAAVQRPHLRDSDGFNRRLYTARFNYAMSHADWSHPLVLGDRSLVTTYVTRWTRWGSPQACIARVEKSHIFSPAPNHIIYLRASLDVVCERIARRVERSYGRHDETVDRLIDAMNAYDDIRFGRVEVPRLRGVRWHVIDTEQPVDRNIQRCVEIIVKAMQSELIERSAAPAIAR